MKKTWLIWLGAAAIVIAGIILCYTTFFTGSGDIAYYTQIDNSKLSRAGGHYNANKLFAPCYRNS